MHAHQFLNDFFNRHVNPSCNEATRSYIVGTLSTYNLHDDLSKRSIVLTFDEATQERSFKKFQTIGDWVLWVGIFQPRLLEHHKVVYESFGRMSYYRCYLMLQKQWRVYEELADELPQIITDVRENMVLR